MNQTLQMWRDLSVLDIELAWVRPGPLNKSQWDFAIGFWMIAENKLFEKQKFMFMIYVRTCYVQQQSYIFA